MAYFLLNDHLYSPTDLPLPLIFLPSAETVPQFVPSFQVPLYLSTFVSLKSIFLVLGSTFPAIAIWKSPPVIVPVNVLSPFSLISIVELEVSKLPVHVPPISNCGSGVGVAVGVALGVGVGVELPEFPVSRRLVELVSLPLDPINM